MQDLIQFNKMLETEFDKERASIQERKSWMRIRRDEEPPLRQLGNAARLYLYMRMNINRSTEEGTWANLNEYYKNGHLAFAKHHTYICKDFGVTRQAIDKWANYLISIGVIIVLGTELITRGADTIPLAIYGLGQWELYDCEGEIERIEAEIG